MADIFPGKVLKNFLSKKGSNVLIRYLKLEDLNSMTVYMNALSQEDTFITYSGEVITTEEEARYVTDFVSSMAIGDKVALCAYVEKKLVGFANINRNFGNRRRGLHVGMFGITIGKDHRNEGIGYALAYSTIQEARREMTGLRLITLDCFDCNTYAKELYKKLGFKEVGKIPGGFLYKGEYFDKTIMSLNF